MVRNSFSSAVQLLPKLNTRRRCVDAPQKFLSRRQKIYHGLRQLEASPARLADQAGQLGSGAR